MNPLKSTLLEAGVSIAGALLSLMLNGIKAYAVKPEELRVLRDNPERLLSLAPGQFEFWLIALTLVIGAHYSSQKGRDKLNQALIALVVALVVLIFLVFMDGAFTFGPMMAIAVPNLIGVVLIFIAVHSIVLAKRT